MQIPLVDLKAQYSALQGEIDSELSDLFKNTAFIMGERVAGFEREFADYCGSRYAVGVSSGTDALLLAYQAAGFERGDEVIVPAHTFIATASPLLHLGIKPVFVDIEPDTYLLDPKKLDSLITPKTKGIVPVHLYGQPADMDLVSAFAEKNGLKIVEDCAQAHGASWRQRPVGNWGCMACFSFYPGKNLGAAGDAGAVITDSEELQSHLKLLVNHGSESKYLHTHLGLNSRLDAIQAAVLRIKLKHIRRWTEDRRRHADYYRKVLGDCSEVVLPIEKDGAHHVYHLFVVRVPGDRDAVLKELNRLGVGAGIHYPIPLHLQPVFAELGYGKGDFPETERAAESIISLPMYPEMTTEQMDFVAQSLRDVIKAKA